MARSKRKLLTNQQIIQASLNLGLKHRYESRHAKQVSLLALKLFTQLKPLHKLGSTSKLLLKLAAILHDIGAKKKAKGHHKISQNIILSANLPLAESEIKKIALIARYHRRQLPNNSHRVYKTLSKKTKNQVNKLAALLRLADGLDVNHHNLVKNLKVKIQPKKIILYLKPKSLANLNKFNIRLKSDLLERVFKKKVKIITE